MLKATVKPTLLNLNLNWLSIIVPPDTNEDTFTRDLWEVGGIFFHGRDNQGQRICEFFLYICETKHDCEQINDLNDTYIYLCLTN